MPDRMIDDVVSVLERFEELLEGLSDDGRVLFYARDLTRLVTWLRTQPRSRLRLDLDAAQARISRALSNDGLRVEDTPKGNRARTIDLSAQTVTLLRAHLARRKAEKLRRGWKEMPRPIFCSTAGTYAHPANVRRAFYRVVRAAGLPHFSPHCLRHTYASLYLTESPHPDVYYLSRMLGHSSIQETADTWWLPANRKGVLDVLDDTVTPRVATNLQPNG